MFTKDRYLPTRQSKLISLLLILIMCCIYIFENSAIVSFFDSRILNYIIKPSIWTSIAFIVWRLPRQRSKGKLVFRSRIYWWAFNFAIFYIIVQVLAGLIDGLGKSPYSHSLIGIITNIIYIGTLLIGREQIRNYLVNNFTKKENYSVFILVTLFMTITSISLKKYTNLNENIKIVTFIAEYFAPEFAHNLLATYLVFLGGPLVSIMYFGIIEGFHWLSPVLPDLKWITKALIGILYPIFSLMTIQSIYLKGIKEINKREQDRESPISWIITSILSIAIIWFAVGVFPIYPSVIATGSMEPMIMPGDVIIVQKIDGNSVDIGDVVQFKRDDILISHRIIEVVEDENGKSYRSKGDNNSVADLQLVKPEQIKGVIKYVVPKIGWLTLLIRSEDDVTMEGIEF
ncbi:signal peptidase I [Vallitalea okinawensis]|uniref:signal peptidase I n=1 Tax=Vallitalea okinawensis TaxID=2078660 RepID=UPI000CFB35D7|nr:signal peptidase I [Vallitalea okinawensis]